MLDIFVKEELSKLSSGSKILDVGASSQRYRRHCSPLKYFSQDFGEATDGLGDSSTPYKYASIDYKGNCWDIGDAETASFDAVLCTEVLEHVPYPAETISNSSKVISPEICRTKE